MSYILAAVAVVVVLYFHLITAVFAGLAVFVLTAKLARRLPTRWGTKAHGIALTGIIIIVVLLVLGFCLVLWAFFSGHEGMAALFAALAETLEDLKHHLPPDVAKLVPDTVEELRGQLATVLREHGRNLTHVGISGAKVVAHLLFGMAIGGSPCCTIFRRRRIPPLSRLPCTCGCTHWPTPSRGWCWLR